MKIIQAIFILLVSILIQVSFIRLLSLFPIAPNLPLVVLFLLCFYLPFEKIIILAIVMGVATDFLSSVSSGSTLLAAFGACALSFYLRENVLRGGRLTVFLLNGLATFLVFYFLLMEANIFLKSPNGYTVIINLMNFNLLGEIFLNLAFSVFGYYLIGSCKNKKAYGFIRSIKISS